LKFFLIYHFFFILHFFSILPSTSSSNFYIESGRFCKNSSFFDCGNNSSLEDSSSIVDELFEEELAAKFIVPLADEEDEVTAGATASLNGNNKNSYINNKNYFGTDINKQLICTDNDDNLFSLTDIDDISHGTYIILDRDIEDGDEEEDIDDDYDNELDRENITNDIIKVKEKK